MALKADLILIDERKGNAVSLSKGFEHRTLGIIDLAAKRVMIDLRDAMNRLKRTNSRYRPATVDSLLRGLKDQ